MPDQIRTEEELRQAEKNCTTLMMGASYCGECGPCVMAATIRALWADLADAEETAVLQSKAILDGEAERDRMKAVYDAAVAWRVIDNAETRGTLLAAVDAAKGKKW